MAIECLKMDHALWSPNIGLRKQEIEAGTCWPYKPIAVVNAHTTPVVGRLP